MLYIEILEDLNNIGIGFEEEILPLFKIKDPINEKTGAIGFMVMMGENNHVSYTYSLNGSIINYSLPDNADQLPLTSVMASITYLGVDYLMKHKMAEKTQRSLRQQFRIGIASIIFLGISILVTGYLSVNDKIVENTLLSIQTQLNKQQLIISQEVAQLQKLKEPTTLNKRRNH